MSPKSAQVRVLDIVLARRARTPKPSALVPASPPGTPPPTCYPRARNVASKTAARSISPRTPAARSRTTPPRRRKS